MTLSTKYNIVITIQKIFNQLAAAKYLSHYLNNTETDHNKINGHYNYRF